jgi:hypothetical protein
VGPMWSQGPSRRGRQEEWSQRGDVTVKNRSCTDGRKVLDQGMQVASTSHKRQGKRFFLEASRGMKADWHFDFRLIDPRTIKA